MIEEMRSFFTVTIFSAGDNFRKMPNIKAEKLQE